MLMRKVVECPHCGYGLEYEVAWGKPIFKGTKNWDLLQNGDY